MNWKCFLVGLALVFPGTLLSVQGRYFNNEESRAVAVDEQEGYLNNLFRLFQQRRQPARLNSYGDGPYLATQRRFSNLDNIPNLAGDDDSGSNSNNQQQQQFENPPAEPLAEKSVDDSLPYHSPPEKEDKSVDDGPVEDSGGVTRDGDGEDQGEIKQVAQAHAPKALALSAEAGRTEVGGSPGRHVTHNTVFIMLVAGCTMLAAVGGVGAGVFWYKYHRSAKATSNVEYPAYGVTGPTKDRIPSPGDRKLAHSAQMYHYQHQKQQMMAMQSTSSGEMKHDGSDDESVEDNDDADYTVYECPGLAPTGEMEVKNPLFRGDDTPSTPANDDSRPSPDY